MATMEPVDNFMKQAVAENVFPGGVLLASKEGSVVFFKAYGQTNIFSGKHMTNETVFDLASLTKPLATTLAVMKLVQLKKLNPAMVLGTILPDFSGTDKQQITIRHLLCHNSGLPDYRPYYEVLKKIPRSERKNKLRNYLLKEPLIYPTGKKVLYSDLGFMILCWIVENISGIRLDRFIDEMVYRPLGIKDLFFLRTDLSNREPVAHTGGFEFAATEKCPWRKMVLEGAVHDDNAYVVGGIEGHAGLFGTAAGVHTLLSELLSGYYEVAEKGVFQSDIIQLFLKEQGQSGRALGFDKPSFSGSSSGKYFSKNSVGHLGFTGTSFWMDIYRKIIVILLTNRVHPSRENEKIKDFRPKIHDAVMQRI